MRQEQVNSTADTVAGNVTRDRDLMVDDTKKTKEVGFVQEPGTAQDVEDQDSDSYDGRTATVLASTVNLINVTIGAGFLALPQAFSMCGYALSTILLLFSVVIAFLGLHFLAACFHKIGGTNNSIGDLVYRTFPRLSWLVDVMIGTLCFGVAASYLIVVGDLGPEIIQFIAGVGPTSVWSDRRIYIAFAFGLVGIPLGCFRDFHSLRYISALAIISVLYLAVLVVLYKVAPNSDLIPCPGYDRATSCPESTIQPFKSGLGVLSALPIFIIAFSAHTNVSMVYNEITKPSVRRVDTASFTCLCVVLVIYVVVGMAGYLTYGDLVEDNILKSYPLSIPVTIGRIFVLMLVMFSYPVLTQPARLSIMNLLKLLPSRSQDENKAELIRYWSTTVFVLAGTFVTSMFVTSLGTVFGVIGSTAATLANFIVPGGLYFANFYSSRKTLLDNVQLAIAALMTIWGFIFAPLALYTIFRA